MGRGIRKATFISHNCHSADREQYFCGEIFNLIYYSTPSSLLQAKLRTTHRENLLSWEGGLKEHSLLHKVPKGRIDTLRTMALSILGLHLKLVPDRAHDARGRRKVADVVVGALSDRVAATFPIGRGEVVDAHLLGWCVRQQVFFYGDVERYEQKLV